MIHKWETHTRIDEDGLDELLEQLEKEGWTIFNILPFTIIDCGGMRIENAADNAYFTVIARRPKPEEPTG